MYYNNISSGVKLNLINLSNARYAYVKFLYVDRKNIYTIGEETGDTINYIVPQTFTFQVSSYLAKKYFYAAEGILQISGNAILRNIDRVNWVSSYSDSNNKFDLM